MKRNSVRELTVSALVAALYVVMTYFGNIFGLSYGSFQCRFAEALCVLPFFFPGTVPGLFIGCVISNILSPYGVVDLVVGSLSTLLAAYITSKMRSKWLAPLPPVICNMVLVGGMLAWYQVGFSSGFGAAFLVNGLWVALGEVVACYGLGTLLLRLLPRSGYFRRLVPENRALACGIRQS